MNLNKIKGIQTIETIMQKLNIKQQTALNLVSKLKKQGYLTKTGGGKQKRIYKISNKKIYPQNGLFSIINKYSKIKIVPYFNHTTYGNYKIEHALIDAIKEKNFRLLLASLYLFQKIKDWKLLYELAKKNNLISEIMALREVAKRYILLSKIPKRYLSLFNKKSKTKKYLIKDIESEDFKIITKKYNIAIPFSEKDLEELK